MAQFKRIFVVAVAAAFLAACAVDASMVKMMQPAGSEFSQSLHKGYVTIGEMEQKEVVSVRGAGQGGDISKVNYHTGIAEGVRRAILRLENEAGAAMGLHDSDGVTQEQLEEMMV